MAGESKETNGGGNESQGLDSGFSVTSSVSHESIPLVDPERTGAVWTTARFLVIFVPLWIATGLALASIH